MKTNFLEWIKLKKELLEEGRRQSQASYSLDADPKIGDVVISNPAAFFKKIMYIPRGKGAELKSPKIRDGVHVAPEDFSSFNIQNIDGRTVHSTRQTSGTYASKSQGASKLFDVKRLRDVTDSFSDPMFDENGTKRFFVDLGKGNNIDNIYKAYLNLTRHSAVGSEEDRRDVAIANLLGGDQEAENRNDGRTSGQQAVANKVNQGANAAVDSAKHKQAQHVTQMVQGLLSGSPINDTSYQELLQIMKGMVEDPYEVKWLRKNGYGNIVDTLHDTGLSSIIAGEENGTSVSDVTPDQEPTDMDALFNQPQRKPNNPAINPAVARAAAQFRGQNQQQPESPEDRIANWLKTASYDPSITSSTRQWKRFHETKTYSYFVE